MGQEPATTRSQRKRRAILEAAAAEFRAAGFQGTSMDRISDRARVSKRTVYNHFPSKDELFRAIVADAWNRACAATGIPYRPGVPLEVQLAEIAHAETALLGQEDYLELVRALVAAGIQAPDLAAPILTELSEQDTGVVAWVREAVSHGALNASDPEMAGEQLLAMIKAFAFWPQVMTGAPPLGEVEAEAVIASAIEVFLAAYRA